MHMIIGQGKGPRLPVTLQPYPITPLEQTKEVSSWDWEHGLQWQKPGLFSQL